MSESPSRAWDGLGPWEKAREWIELYPEMAETIMQLSRTRAEQLWAQEESESSHRRSIESSERAHARALEVRQQEFRETIARRVWFLQVASLAGGAVSLTANAVLSILYLQAGHITPGLAVLGAGGVLTGGLYASSRRSQKDLAKSAEGDT